MAPTVIGHFNNLQDRINVMSVLFNQKRLQVLLQNEREGAAPPSRYLQELYEEMEEIRIELIRAILHVGAIDDMWVDSEDNLVCDERMTDPPERVTSEPYIRAPYQ